jgi:hypothetical protein
LTRILRGGRRAAAAHLSFGTNGAALAECLRAGQRPAAQALLRIKWAQQNLQKIRNYMNLIQNVFEFSI